MAPSAPLPLQLLDARSESAQEDLITSLRQQLDDSKAAQVRNAWDPGHSLHHSQRRQGFRSPCLRDAPQHPVQEKLRAAAAAAEAERNAQASQAKKLLADMAKLQEQLTSATGDIFTLQVRLSSVITSHS